jgi:hypothetical protein
MSITKGQTFGTSEQITNTKLHNLVDLATIDLTTGIAIGSTSPSIGAFSAISASAFNLVQIPVTATASAQQTAFTCDSIFNLKLNGVNYYIPCASATS